MLCERRAGRGGSGARRARPSILGGIRRGTGFLAGTALLAGCAGLPDVLQSPPENELAARAPEDAPRHRRRSSGALETFRLANGLEVVLLEDPAAAKVVVDTWIGLGARDEAPGLAGAAEVFERLVGQAAVRLPSALRERVEAGGGSSSASAGVDRTHAFSLGPPGLLADLLWIEASRLAPLDPRAVAAELARHAPSGAAAHGAHGVVERVLAETLYPPEHPYYRPMPSGLSGHAGDAAELRADALAAVLGALHAPANASVVVAGAFDPASARAEVERAFGALPALPPPARRAAPEVAFSGERCVVVHERVAVPKLVLAWHSPAARAPHDAELDLVATLLAEGPESRLERRLVLDGRLAQEVDACQLAAELGSVFLVEAQAAPGVDLDELARVILGELDDLARHGPAADELERARERAQARFLRRMESLLARAEAVQAYRRAFGDPDGFERDLARWTDATAVSVRDAARATFGAGRVDLRVLPADGATRESLAAGPLPGTSRP